MADRHVHTINNRFVCLRIDRRNSSLLAFVLAGQNDHFIPFTKFCSHYRTSGANEMIFMKFLPRSSRTTGPKIRVPTGSPALFKITAAFESKRIAVPSSRRTSLAVRTTTALRTSPFFTRPRGMASLTETTMMSPTDAYLRLEPPNTLMHCTRRAPELSATSRFVCIWIMLCLRPMGLPDHCQGNIPQGFV